MKKKIRCPYFELNDLERAYHDKAELRQAIRNAARRHFARRRGDAARLSCEEMEGVCRYAKIPDAARILADASLFYGAGAFPLRSFAPLNDFAYVDRSIWGCDCVA